MKTMTTKHVLQIKFCILFAAVSIGYNGIAQKESNYSINIEQNSLKDHRQNLPIGHQEIRRLLGNDIGQMEFDTPVAKNFRNYIKNSLLETTSYNSDSGYKNYHRKSGSGKIQLCADGTYVEALYYEIIVDVDGTTATSSGTTYISGYWEVAALPNGMFIILFYSQHPNVLEEYPNGLQPWIVPKYGDDFVSLPSGEFYKRTANIHCN